MGTKIKDIAEKADVSPATVSLVLNNKPGVGEETREKILKIAKELNYQSQKTFFYTPSEGDSLCFLHISRHGHTVNRDHDVFIADYIEGLGQGAKQYRLSMEIVTFKATPIEKIIETAEGLNVSGLIVLGTELTDEDIDAFGAVKKPVVFIDTYPDFLKFDFVDMNNEDSVYTIIEHLAAHGHRRIGLVKGSVEIRNFRLREDGFIASLQKHGLPFSASDSFSVDSTFHGAYDDMKAILERRKDLPTALFCVNDIIACGCLRAFKEAGIRVPEDVSIVGFDDLPLSTVVDPPLTTIQVSKAHIGRMAVQLLFNRLREKETPPVKVLVGGKLIPRQSVLTLSS